MCGEPNGRECGAEDEFPQALTRPLSSLDPRGFSTTTAGSQTAQELLRVEMQNKNKTKHDNNKNNNLPKKYSFWDIYIIFGFNGTETISTTSA